MMPTRTLKTVLLTVCLVGFPIGGFWLGGKYVEAVNRSKDLSMQGGFAQMELALLMYHD